MNGEARTFQIVLVEDNPADVLLIREALKEQQLDFQLHVVNDGEKALAYARGEGGPDVAVDLILLDLNLPKRHGTEILATILRHPQLRRVPVAVLTSSDFRRDREDAARLGAARYLRKPCDLDEFLQIGVVVKQMLSGARQPCDFPDAEQSAANSVDWPPLPRNRPQQSPEV